jgi:hypothetical protein
MDEGMNNVVTRIRMGDVYRVVSRMAEHGDIQADEVAERLLNLNCGDMLARFIGHYEELHGTYGHCTRWKALMQEVYGVLAEAYSREAARAIYDVRAKKHKGDE